MELAVEVSLLGGCSNSTLRAPESGREVNAGWFPAHQPLWETVSGARGGMGHMELLLHEKLQQQQEPLIAQSKLGLDAAPRCCWVEIFHNSNSSKTSNNNNDSSSSSISNNNSNNGDVFS